MFGLKMLEEMHQYQLIYHKTYLQFFYPFQIESLFQTHPKFLKILILTGFVVLILYKQLTEFKLPILFPWAITETE
jgi:hypothetical protein